MARPQTFYTFNLRRRCQPLPTAAPQGRAEVRKHSATEPNGMAASGQMQTPRVPFGRRRNAVALPERCLRNHEREVAMGVVPRDFLLLATLAAAAASVTAAFGQAVTPAVGPTCSGAQSAASIPDFSGIWSHPYFPGFEPPASGPGPVTNRLRLRGGPQRGVSDPRQLVGDYTNPILKTQAAEFVKKHGEMELSGVGSSTPTNQCWPEPVPYILRAVAIRMLQLADK